MNEEKLSLEAKKKLINLCFTEDLDDRIEFGDEEAIELFELFALNIDVFERLLGNHSIRLDKGETGDKYFSPTTYRIYSCETDEVVDLLNGSFVFEGSIDFTQFDGSLMLSIQMRDFKIYNVWAIDDRNDDEIAIIDSGYIIKELGKEQYKTGPQTYDSRYKFTRGEKIG